MPHKKLFFVSSLAWDKEKILSPYEKSNLIHSSFVLWVSEKCLVMDAILNHFGPNIPSEEIQGL